MSTRMHTRTRTHASSDPTPRTNPCMLSASCCCSYPSVQRRHFHSPACTQRGVKGVPDQAVMPTQPMAPHDISSYCRHPHSAGAQAALHKSLSSVQGGKNLIAAHANGCRWVQRAHEGPAARQLPIVLVQPPAGPPQMNQSTGMAQRGERWHLASTQLVCQNIGLSEVQSKSS